MTDEKKPEMKIEVWPIDQLIPYARNPRHNEESVDAVAASIKAFGWKQPIVVDKENVIVIGHTRMKAARRLGMTHVPVHVSDLSDEENKALRIADNSTASKSGFDLDLLKLELPELPSFKMEEFNLDLGFLNEPANPRDEQEHKTLADRFMVPPFSVLNAREGWWQDRKRAWIALGIKSELGRGGEGQLLHTLQESRGMLTGRLTIPDQKDKPSGLTGRDSNRDRERVASFKNQDKLNAFRRGAVRARPVITARDKEATGEGGQ